MKKIDNFVNLYPVTKTLRFKLIPIGKTKENFDKNKLLEIDKERAEKYEEAKGIIDKYYNDFINNCLNNFKFKSKPNNLTKYYEIQCSNEDAKKKTEMLKTIQNDLRKEIVSSFSDTASKKKVYDKLCKGELLEEILEDARVSEHDKEVIQKFDKFSTYFKGFFTNRENVFSSEDKVGSISYRCINENLKTFINNIKVYSRIKESLQDDIKKIEKEYASILKNFKLDDIFNIEFYNLCLTGEDINKYNQVIGGFPVDEKNRIQGLNEYINLYNQKNKEVKDNYHLPKFKQLYKQILSDDKAQLFRFDVIENDNEVYNLINDIISLVNKKNILKECKAMFNFALNHMYNNDKIYYTSDKFAYLSIKCFDNYNVINLSIDNDYELSHKNDKRNKKYETGKNKYLKDIKYFSLEKLCELVEKFGYDKSKIFEKINDEAQCIISDAENALKKYNSINKTVSIRDNKEIIETIKLLLDSFLSLYKFKESFCKYDDTEDIDLIFYGNLSELDFLNRITGVYNKVRNYITKKPYKLDKIKLNFNCSTLLDGWDVNKEKDNLGVLMVKDGKYYLAIMNKSDNKVFMNVESQKCADYYKKVNYKLLPGPNKMLPKVFLSKKGIETFNPSKKLIDKYNSGTHRKGDYFNKRDMEQLIDYFKESINRHVDYSNFGFKFTNTEEYNDISEFYREVSEQGYKITYTDIPCDYIEKLVNEGKLFLFQIYNKDFSSYSNGRKNLHTLYFEQLFSQQNLKDVVYKLNGEAEVFLREKSIEYKVTHPKNKAVQNKNIDNIKKESIFNYDLIKDKRFTEDQFEFHVPITINFKAYEGLYNEKVNLEIVNCKDNYVIGIDRGERNLIYINVVSEKKGLIEQLSLNDIINEYNGNTYRTDYHSLLDKREKERDDARKSWGTIENIKGLKEGYISQVVHKICELVEKYDAIIVMEDLNAGFKNSRVKVEKQVYQKFEKMLIDKLNLYINKKYEVNKEGGLLKGYQLTRPYQGDKYMSYQNGFIYYIGPWNTSKIDPTTGFVNLFRLSNYQSVESKQKFISKFDSIKYNKNEDIFEFAFDYKNFDYGATDYIGKWTITSYGKRILTFRNKEKKSTWDNVDKYPTLELKELLNDYNIDYITRNLKDEILKLNDRVFFDKLFNILKLILQMRNSITNSEVDYLISPVKNKNGKQYNSDDAKANCENLPFDADSNGAFNIARKGLMIVDRIKKGVTDKLTIISNQDWIEYAQTHLPI